MKAFYQITSGKTGIVLLNRRSIAKDINRWLRQTAFTMFLALFLLMIFAPVNASTGSGENKKSECRAKKTSFTYPVIIKANKKSSGHNKYINKPKKRKYSFPV